MFEVLLLATFAVALLGVIIAFDGSRDVFHPLMLTGPMFAFLYGWMPWNLMRTGDLATFFDDRQLVTVQTVNLLGVIAFVAGCLAAGTRNVHRHAGAGSLWFPGAMGGELAQRLVTGGTAVGSLGLMAWLTLIVKSGGPVQAFGKAYSGGWDDSGYVRDGSILLLAGVLLILAGIAAARPRPVFFVLLGCFALPWAIQAILTSRRGPTFALVVVLSMGWFLHRRTRPPVLFAAAAGVALGWLVLFLVANRSSIYLGSDKSFTTEVTSIVETPNTGNEYIYGSGSLLSSMRRERHFWGMRYLAQILVRPVPTAIWPNKYEDFGVPELLHNAGTGEGIADTMGWQGADGSAPGIIADLWVEAAWLGIPSLGIFGWIYGKIWRKAVTAGRAWTSQYAILSALSIYLVMQTMEAVIFRMLLLSVPLWVVWWWADQATSVTPDRENARVTAECAGV